MVKFFTVFYICVVFTACAVRNNIQTASSPQTHQPETRQKEPDIWYGADVSGFPPQIVDWIKKTGFPKEKMEQTYAINPQLKVWWSEDGNSVNFQASYTVAPGYVGAGTVKTWGEGARYNGSDSIWSTYGDYAKYKTLRFEWELKQSAEKMYDSDPAYRAVVDAARQMCKEIEYDWANFGGYRGAKVIRTPGLVYYVCDGYADEAMKRFLALSCVKSVEKWSLPGVHAWNNLLLKDGRRLYVDVTWFDNEHIDEHTGRIYQTDDYDWENITFDRDLFDHSNVGYGTKTFVHADSRKKLENVVPK
jgi:hypothetical protein